MSITPESLSLRGTSPHPLRSWFFPLPAPSLLALAPDLPRSPLVCMSNTKTMMRCCLVMIFWVTATAMIGAESLQTGSEARKKTRNHEPGATTPASSGAPSAPARLPRSIVACNASPAPFTDFCTQNWVQRDRQLFPVRK